MQIEGRDTMAHLSPEDSVCQICGQHGFVHDDVLWPELVEAWEIDGAETHYVNVQQGTRCERCGSNVRSQALAKALLQWGGAGGPLEQRIQEGFLSTRHVLEINEAGTLTPWLSRLPFHVIGRYPECDMTNLAYADESFDLVVHSDTLEHVADPDRALRECRRVLAPGGACVFTVPIIVGRLTRSRRGLAPSYHGHKDCRDPDFMVHTEFGADAWTSVLTAGFTTCQIVAFRYPAGLAIIAQR
jgi:SAM-dependent methyltransferase